MTVRSIRGMNDILPHAVQAWRQLETQFRDICELHGYGEVRLPVVEKTELFHRTIGDTTDIVEKEMYSFVDKGGDALTLRPEGTAATARAFLEHNAGAEEPVTKWFYMGSMYRRERPARGRYRQFHQIGAECFGDPSPYADAELMALACAYLKSLGLHQLEVRINSLGSSSARTAYLSVLKEYFQAHRGSLSEDSLRRLESNPMRILDSKSPEDQALLAQAPRLSQYLSEEDTDHFKTVQSCMDSLGLAYVIDPHLVRGLDYYSRTLFEVHDCTDALGAQSAVCGGGRYDGLIPLLGGKPTPAVGFAMGLERLLALMPDSPSARTPTVFVVSRSPSARREALQISSNLRALGFSVDGDYRGTSVKSQMRRASKSGATWVVFATDGDQNVIEIKNMEQGEQHTVATEQLPQVISGQRPPNSSTE